MRATLLVAVLALSGFAQAAVITNKVPTDKGLVTGVAADGVESFKGIPFAAPPVGDLRWRAPQPAEAWKGVKAADKYGPGCMQILRDGSLTGNPDSVSEDCLTLNVFRPAGAAKNLPVMVWIYGGGLSSGAGGLPVHEGAAFAKGGVILVHFNYRLGRLGFFAHPALVAENADGGRFGNYGLLDEIAALKWVQKNIAAFGGDPNNVTIFGESAGAYSVLTLMVAQEARGLFHKAISQSGYGRGPYPRVSEAAANGARMAEAAGLKDASVADLRALPAEKVIARYEGLVSFPTFTRDDKTIAADMWDAFRQGKEAPVPLIIGANSQEAPPLTDLNTPNVRGQIPPTEDAALEQAYGSRDALLNNLGGDLGFAEQARSMARIHAANGHPTYLYSFGVVSAADAAEGKGARHATDIRYVFDTLPSQPKPVVDPAPAVAKTINGYWRAFAATGTPNVSWPKYDGKTVMLFTRDGANAIPDPRNARLDALTKIVGPKS